MSDQAGASTESSPPGDAVRSLDEVGVGALFEHAFDLMCLGGGDGRLVAVNPAFQRRLGWTPAEMMSRPIFDFVHPDDRARTRELYAMTTRGGEVIDFENRYAHRDGGWRWLQWRAGALAGGRFHAVGREVTTQRRERAMMERTQRIARIGGWQVDFVRGELYWTPETYRLHDVDPAVFRPDVATAINFYIPADRPRITGALQGLLDKAQPYDEELQIVTASGRVIDVRAEGLPIVEGGRVVGAFGAFADISRRKRTETMLRRMASVVRSAPSPILFTTPDRRIQWLNPAAIELLGYDESIYGQPSVLLFTQDSIDRFQRHVAPALETARVWRGEMTALRADRIEVPMMSTVVAHYDLADEVEFISATLEDLSALRALENRIHHRQRLESVGLLASGLAHDFNNLLTVIAANASELMEAIDDPELTEMVSEITDTTDHGAALTRRLMTLARKDAPRAETIDLTAVVVELVRTLGRMLGSDIEIAVRRPELNWPIKVDPTHLEQILLNLATNARDAMSGGGTLLFDISNQVDSAGQDMMRLRVVDDGAGMAPVVAARVFDPFYTTKPRDRGTGLGLSTCQWLMHRAEGEIAIDSVLGAGTVVTLTFPRVHGGLITSTSNPAVSAVPGGDEILLFVEDHPDINEMMSRRLSKLGYSVDAFTSAEEAIEWIADGGRRPSLIVTDVSLPGMNGRQGADRLSTLVGPVPVLYASGEGVDKLASMGVPVDARVLLRKPYTVRDLAERIRGLIDGA